LVGFSCAVSFVVGGEEDAREADVAVVAEVVFKV
jgi:hypothetical protein